MYVVGNIHNMLALDEGETCALVPPERELDLASRRTRRARQRRDECLKSVDHGMQHGGTTVPNFGQGNWRELRVVLVGVSLLDSRAVTQRDSDLILNRYAAITTADSI